MCRIVLWILDQVRNDVTMLVHRFHPHLKSSPIKGEGILLVVLDSFHPCHPAAPLDCGSSPQ